MDGHRKLIVMGVNKLLEHGKISLKAGDKTIDGHLLTELAGEHAVISWHDAGYDEIRVSVWWKYDHSNHPQANASGNSLERFRTTRPLARASAYPRFVGAFASAWVEREKGPHIQGHGSKHLFDVYTRKNERAHLDALPTPKPNGFEVEGEFYV